MIKVDYEGAWKELKENIKNADINCVVDYTCKKYPDFVLNPVMMEKLEQKHTHNYVDIRRRSDKEVADYCLKKYADMYLELVELESKLKKLAEGECEVKKC